MFFYVDESGHTGPNLFDEKQPVLYYGVLSASVNLDAVAETSVRQAREQLGVERLHAAEMGLGGLVAISDHLISIQKRFQPRFDVYRVAKPDHAVICFFDQGVNPAMTWTGYWTPLRYMLLVKVAHLFDDDLARRAWKARTDIHDKTAEAELVFVCNELIKRLPALPDARSRQLVGDALNWAIRNTNELGYNCQSKKEVLTVTPNVVGFQSVMHGIASRLKSPKAKASITVDQQSQFNKAQKNLAEFYASARHVPWVSGPGLPKMDLSRMPSAPIKFSSGKDSVGLELVDCYLWLFKRVFEKKELANEVIPLIQSQMRRGHTDCISINAIAQRWTQWFRDLPEPTEEQMEAAKAIRAIDEERRLKAVRSEL